MKPIDFAEAISNMNIDYGKIYAELQNNMGIPADMMGGPVETEYTTDKSFENLKVLIGEAFALGLQIQKEKSRFGSEEAYREWCKGKPQEHLEEMLMEIIKKVMKLFESNDKSLKETKVPTKVKKAEPKKTVDPNKIYPYYEPHKKVKPFWGDILEEKKQKIESDELKKKAMNELYKNNVLKF